MKYENYNTSDFLKDEYFLQWVLNPNTETSHFWENWLANHPEKVSVVSKAQQLIKEIHYQEQHQLNSQQYTSMLEHIIRFQRSVENKKHYAIERHVRKSWRAVAASILILAVAFGYYQYQKSSEIHPEPLITYITKETPLGVKATFLLPDGSSVKLNAGSTLQYPSQFDDEKREVFLTGEGFFDVIKDSSRAFIIHSQNVQTSVLGTEFNVRAYNNENQVKVAVISGLVKVSNSQNEEYFIEPSMMAVYDNESEVMETKPFDIKQETGWYDGVLYFKEEELTKVFERLEAWYGVEIIIKGNQHINQIYSGEYQNESLENVLKGIGYTAGFQFNIEGKQATVF